MPRWTGGALPGNAVLAARLTGMADRSIATTPVMESMVVAFHEYENYKFEKEGPGWQELASSTIDVKNSLGYAGTNILERTGTLWDSLTGVGDYSTVTVSPLGWESISIVPYAGWHVQGVPEHNMPARPPVDLPGTPRGDALIASWIELLQRYVVGFGIQRISAAEMQRILS